MSDGLVRVRVPPRRAAAMWSKQPRYEPLSEHQFGQNGQVGVLAETSGLGRALPRDLRECQIFTTRSESSQHLTNMFL
jgi:hypothetical protein